jgi:hypothetical protein
MSKWFGGEGRTMVLNFDKGLFPGFGFPVPV